MSISVHATPALALVERAEPSTPKATGFSELLQSDRVTKGAESTRVRPTRTPLSAEQASEALSHAWTRTFGEPPNKATLAILTAQWSHETGRGESMFNYNFGGIKGTGPSGLTVAQRTREGWGATSETIVDNFRAYQTPEEGALDYIALLNRRYGGALDAAREGDPEGFVRELKQRGYFTGNEQLYGRSIARLAQQALDQGVGLLGAGGPLPDRELLSRRVEFTPGARPTGPSSSFLDFGFAAGLGEMMDGVRADAIADEMSRAALRLALETTRFDSRRSR